MKKVKEEKQSDEVPFTKAEVELLDKRRQNRISGVSKTYSWEEAKEIIRARKAKP